MEEVEKAAANAAYVDGVFQSDSSRHTVGERVIEAKSEFGNTVSVTPREGFPTLNVAYFFSGTHRKGSVADSLKTLCEEKGLGLRMCEVDIHVGGSDHDLFDGDAQEQWITRIAAGDFHFVVLSPPCNSWSRCQYANTQKPRPVRSREHPWGKPGLLRSDRKRANDGNAFVLFAIRAITSIAGAKRKGFYVRSLLEHPEDLGATPPGVPASIWQLKEVKTAHGEFDHACVAGHNALSAWMRPSRLGSCRT